MTIKNIVDDFYANHGHYGLIRGGPLEMFRLGPGAVDNLPEVEYATLPISAGVMSWLQVESQGGIGACQGHAQTSAAEVAYYRESRGKTIQLNRMFAYLVSQKIDGIRGDNGSTMEGGARAAAEYGLALESLWPYTGRYVGFDRIPAACFPDAKTRLLRHWEQLSSYRDVMRWLVHGIGGVVIGIGWNSSMEPDSSGRIERYRHGGGGHALAIVDWRADIKDGKGQPYIVMPNSWGKEWGDNGVAYLAPNVIQQFCEGETVIGYSDLDGEGIAPRPLWSGENICA